MMASGKTYVGYATQSYSDGDKQSGITAVEVYNGSVSGTAGSGTQVLRVEFPSAKTESDATSIATAILAQVTGYQYKPYKADNAIVDLAAELGDGVSVCGNYGGVYTQEQTFNAACLSNISAPEEEEVDSEYAYKTKQELVNNRTQESISDVDDRVTSIEADYVNTTQLNAVSARISAIEADYVVASELSAVSARVTTIEAGYLTASSATITTLQANVASLQRLTSGNATISYLKVQSMTYGANNNSVSWWSKSSGTNTYVLGGNL